MRYRVLGPVAAVDGAVPTGLGGPRARAVLALLLADADRVVTDERLIDGIWGDDAPQDARHAIQNHVSRLRRALDDEIVREGGGYRLVVDPAAVDAHRFATLVSSARERLADAPAAAGALLRDALALWRGEPYADLSDVPALQPEIRRLRSDRLTAVEDRVQADLDAGGHAEVAAELDVLTREHPFRERLYGMRMRALYRAGRQAEALEVFQKARRVLSDELGIDPSPELVELHGRILAQDPALRADVAHRAHDAGAGGTAVVGGSLPVIHGFELREHLGDGDFGRTYRAYHAALGREVALKVLRGELSDLPDVVRSFEPRARRVAQLDHPHIAPLLDSWRDPGAAYLVTPWSPAGDVRRALQHGPWTPAATLRMLEQVGAALDLAHRHGVVHGDVKATNVLLSDDGNARLVDFAMTPRPRDALGVPQTNDPGIIPPEERRGASPTTAGDVHALAAVAIEVLTGERVRPERPAEPLSERADLPSALIEALEDGTAVDPAHRPPRVTELLRRVRRALGADVVALSSPADDDVTAMRNPYKGLHPFGEDDAVDFFGRAAAVDRLLQAIGEQPLVAVVGPSGCGKSSIVRAGAVPELRAGRLPGSQRWLVAQMYPGSHPFDELAVALLRVAVDPPDDLTAALTGDARGLARVIKQILPGDDTQLLLVIDQFEELFSLTPDVTVRRAFLDSLVALADDARGRVRTVVTLRADFFARPLEHHRFGELLRAGLISVTVPSRDELAQAVSAPARNVGAEFAPGLVGRIVGDVVDQPGGLPLLQYALTELFARRDGRMLTRDAYDDAGGVRGALGRRAEELYAALPATRQPVARQVFLRLVSVDEHAGETRRRARRGELARLADDQAAVGEVLQRFGAHRLLTFDHDPVTRGPTVEVAHEALLSEWGRLRRWITDRRDDLLLHRRLASDTVEWREAGQADGFLVTGGRLDQYVRFVASTDLALDRDERDFVAASEQREVTVTRRRRRQRGLLALAAASVVVLAIVLIAFGLVQRERDAVSARLEHASSLAAASRAAQATDADLAVLLAREAVRITGEIGDRPTSYALGALHEAVLGHRLVAAFDVDTFSVRFVGREQLITQSTADRGPTLWDIPSGSRIRTLERATVDGGGPVDIALSADGRRWAEAHLGATPTIVWDVASGRVLRRIPAQRDGRDAPTFDPTGELLAIVDFRENEPNVVRVYDIATGAERQRITLDGVASRIAISPDGGTLAAASAQRPVVELFDLETGELRDVVRGPRDAQMATSVAFDPSGGALAAVFQPARLQLHEVPTGVVIGTARLDTENPFDVCFSADGSALVVTSIGAIDVFAGDTAAPVTYIRDAEIGSRASCGADGTQVAAGSTADRARVWDITPAAPTEVWSSATPEPLGAEWVGDAVVTLHADRRLRRYVQGRGLTATSGIATPTDPFPLATDGAARLATFSRPGGDADTDPADTLVLRDAETLRVTGELATASEPHAFNTSGELLLVSRFSTVEVLDVATAAVRTALDADWTGLTPPVGAFLSDDRHAVVDDLFRTVVFELDTGEAVATICAEAFSSRVVTSHEGGLFAVDGPRGTEVYDAAEVLDENAAAASDCDGPNPVAVRPIALLAGTDVRSMAFSSDGAHVTTVSDDGDVAVWDARSGDLVVTIPHVGDVGGGTFSADGRHLAVTVDDPMGDADAVRIYTLEVDELLGLADAKVTREFTAEECAVYGVAAPCGAPD